MTSLICANRANSAPRWFRGWSRRTVAGFLTIVLATMSAVFGLQAPAQAYSFYAYGATQWAIQYAYSDPSGYKHYGEDCTNFISTAWNRGGGVPMGLDWHQANFGWNGYWYYEGSSDFIRASSFRHYWYDHGSRYVHVEGKTALTSPYSPAGYGDAYVFDTGDNPFGPDWNHVSIEAGWASGYDKMAQHSIGEIVDWRTWYYHRDSYQRWNFLRSGHGIRIISP